MTDGLILEHSSKTFLQYTSMFPIGFPTIPKKINRQTNPIDKIVFLFLFKGSDHIFTTQCALKRLKGIYLNVILFVWGRLTPIIYPQTISLHGWREGGGGGELTI